MAGRRKQSSAPGSERTPGAGAATNKPLPAAAAAPVVEESGGVVAIEIPPDPGSSSRKANGRKNRSRQSIPDTAGPSLQPSVLSDVQGAVAQVETPGPPPFLSDATESLRQVMQSCKEVQEQLGTVRQGLKDVAKEMGEMRERSREVKQDVVEAGGFAGPFGAVRQELQDIHRAMGTLRHEVEATREDLKTRMREAGAHFFAVGEACQDLKREVSEVLEQIQSLRPGTLNAIAGSEPAPPVALTPGSANGKGEQATIVDEHGSPIESEPPFPEMELDHPAPSPEAKKLLGLTVGLDAVVVDVLAHTPADKAGLRVGDKVLSVDGAPIANSEELRSAIEQVDFDKEVLLTVTRGQETQAISVQLSTPMELVAVAH